MTSPFRFLYQPSLKIAFIGISLILIPALQGCGGGVKRTLGLEREAPDEFRVVSQAPLSVPPDFTLTPPAPGAQRPQDASTEEGLKSLVLSGSESGATFGTEEPIHNAGTVLESSLPSPGESTLLNKADAGAADPNIREALAEEERAKIEKKASEGMFHKVFSTLRHEDEDTKDPLVDAKKEKERIVTQQKEGQPVDGRTTPVIPQKKKSVLDRMLDW